MKTPGEPAPSFARYNILFPLFVLPCDSWTAGPYSAAAAAGLAVTDATSLVGVALVIIAASNPVPIAIIECGPAPLAVASAALPAIALGAARVLPVPAVALSDGVRRRSHRVLSTLADGSWVNTSRKSGCINLHHTQSTTLSSYIFNRSGETTPSVYKSHEEDVEELHVGNRLALGLSSLMFIWRV